MKIIRDDLWLCPDCRIAATNGDFTALDNDSDTADARYAAIVAGLEALGPHLVNDEGDDGDGHEEFKASPCDCCGTPLAGERFRFAVLGE